MQIISILLYKNANILKMPIFNKLYINSKIIAGHIRSLYCLKIHILLYIFFFLNSCLIFLKIITLWNLDLRSYGQLLSLFIFHFPKKWWKRKTTTNYTSSNYFKILFCQNQFHLIFTWEIYHKELCIKQFYSELFL